MIYNFIFHHFVIDIFDTYMEYFFFLSFLFKRKIINDVNIPKIFGQ